MREEEQWALAAVAYEGKERIEGSLCTKGSQLTKSSEGGRRFESFLVRGTVGIYLYPFFSASISWPRLAGWRTCVGWASCAEAKRKKMLCTTRGFIIIIIILFCSANNGFKHEVTK